MTTHWTAEVSERSPLAGRRRRDILSRLCESSKGGDACRGSMRPRGLNAVGYKGAPNGKVVFRERPYGRLLGNAKRIKQRY
jgi:hypothetical protein